MTIFLKMLTGKVIERITLNSAISGGLAERDAGEGITVERVERDLKEWAKR